jgi:hypothetical protein
MKKVGFDIGFIYRFSSKTATKAEKMEQKYQMMKLSVECIVLKNF